MRRGVCISTASSSVTLIILRIESSNYISTTFDFALRLTTLPTKFSFYSSEPTNLTMLSPAFETTSYLPTLLPSLPPSPFTQSKTSSTLNIPRSPCTPRISSLGLTPGARITARTIISTSPYFSPSNPFSTRREPGQLSARYTIINTLSSPGASTPGYKASPRAGSRTLRQRSRVLGDTLEPQVVKEGKRLGMGMGKEEVKEVGRTVVSLVAWVLFGMVVSLGVLSIRAKMEGGFGGAGTVRITHNYREFDTASEMEDVWASRMGMTSEEMAPLKSIWDNEGGSLLI